MRVKSLSVNAAAVVVGAWMGLCATVASAQVTVPPPRDTESRQHGFTVERIYGTSSLLGHPTTGIVWAPDGKHVSYFTDLAGGEAKQGRRKELWEMDAATGEKELLVGADKLDNALPAEAQNTSQATGLGRHAPGQYQWAPNGEALLLQGGTALAWFDLKSQTAKALVSGKEAIADPKMRALAARVTLTNEKELDALFVGHMPAMDVAAFDERIGIIRIFELEHPERPSAIDFLVLDGSLPFDGFRFSPLGRGNLATEQRERV